MTFTEIKSDIDFLVNTNSTNYPDADKARNVNRHLADVVSLILRSDGKWKWDDTNQTNNPIGLIDLVNNQQDYEVVGTTYLKITGVDVKDQNGKHVTLLPVDRTGGTAQELNYLEEGTIGMPRYYDKVGDSLYLYPIPSSSLTTLTDGLRVHYQRGASYFVEGDGAKVPGFAEPYHRILSLGAALDYAIANDLTKKVKTIGDLLGPLKEGLVEHYASRDVDDHPRMRLRSEDYSAYSMDSVSNTRGISDKRAY